MKDETILRATFDCDKCGDNNIEVIDGIVVCAKCGKPVTSTLEIMYVQSINVWRD